VNAARIIRAVSRRWWIPLVIAVVAVVAVLGLSSNVSKAEVQYTAKTILVVNPSSNQNSAVNLPEAALQVTVGAVPKVAAAALHYSGNPAALAGEVNASYDATVGTLTLSVTSTNGPWAADVANEFATALNQQLTATATSAYQAQVQQVESRLNSLQNQVNQYQGRTDPISEAKLGAAEDQYRLAYDQFQQLAAQGTPQQPFTVLQKAVPVPSGGVHPPRSRLERAVIGAVAGLVVGIVLAVLLDMLWPRIDDRADAEQEFGTVVLAEVPRLPRRLRQDGARHSPSDRRMAPFREAYRMLRTGVLLLGSGSEADGTFQAEHGSLVGAPRVILVSSPLPREGKSTTVASLAVSMAETGRRVLVLNADFRAPQVQKAFDLPPGPGLTDLLAGAGGGRRLSDLVHPTKVPGVSFVHSGTEVANAAELIARRGGQILAEARALADVVLLDTAPLLVVSDASELLPEVDAVIMVARAGRTTRDGARRSFELLDRAGIPVLGVVLVGASSPMSYYYGGRYGAYGYGARGWRGWLERRQGNRQVIAVRPDRSVTPARHAGNGNGKGSPAPPRAPAGEESRPEPVGPDR
jgi:capsular exopolysaccharide synthesis family protein